MAEVAAGAAVIAFINLALKSTKTIYETLSTVRKCPAEIKSLTSAILNLAGVLTQLSNEATLSLIERQLDLESFRQFSDLLKACNDDVHLFERDLEKVKVTTQDKKAGVTWKKIKSVLKEAEFRRMGESVHHHVAELELQLSLIQSKSGLNHETQLRKTNSDLTVIGSDVKGLVRTSTSVMQQVRNELSPIAQKLDQIPEISAAQSENICVRLKALEDQVSGLSAQVNLSEPSRCQELPRSGVSQGMENGSAIEEDSELERGIERLSQLVKAKQGTVTDTEAEVVIDDLSALLKSVVSQTSPGCVGPSPTKEKAMNGIGIGSKIEGRELKRMFSLLDSSDAIIINGTARPFPHFNRVKIGSTNQIKEFQSKHCKVIWTTKTKQWQALPLSSDGEIGRLKQSNEFVGTITTFLEKSRVNLTVNIHQRMMDGGYFSMSPSIMVGMTLPDDSPVFEMVKTGDMDGLMNLLDQGKASLRDRDSFGTPLLHYAVKKSHICKFLIEHGADVDEIASSPTERDFFLPPLSEHRWSLNHNIYSAINDSHKVLLNAGADPTVEPARVDKIRFGSPLLHAAWATTDESLTLRTILDLGGCFIGLKEKNEVVSNLACKSEQDPSSPNLTLLLDRGADVNARLRGTGETFLHIFLSVRAGRVDPSRFNFLVTILKYGADIDAVNDGGISVSEQAYSVASEDKLSDLGGYRGDLWDAVLSKCGYDIAERRKGFPRTPHYDDRYRREDFEELWRGRRKDCPYYHDPPVWDPEDLDAQETFRDEQLFREERIEDLDPNEEPDLRDEQHARASSECIESRATSDQLQSFRDQEIDEGEHSHSETSEAQELGGFMASSTTESQIPDPALMEINTHPSPTDHEIPGTQHQPVVLPTATVSTSEISTTQSSSNWQQDGHLVGTTMNHWAETDTSDSPSRRTRPPQHWNTGTGSKEGGSDIRSATQGLEILELEPNPWV